MSISVYTPSASSDDDNSLPPLYASSTDDASSPPPLYASSGSEASYFATSSSAPDKKLRFEAYIDGACSNNGTEYAQGGVGVVIVHRNEVIAKCSSAMCHCSGVRHTSNRAEIDALLDVIRFIHEFAKFGKPEQHSENKVCDHRGIEPGLLGLKIKTDSRYVKDTWNRRMRIHANHDLWDKTLSYKSCVAKAVDLKVEHVRGHSGDRFNEFADKLARTASQVADPCEWRQFKCMKCKNTYQTSLDLAIHMKTVHFLHYLVDNELAEAFSAVSFGSNTCEMCTGKFGSNMALKNHMRDAHGIKFGRRGKIVPCTVAERQAAG